MTHDELKSRIADVFGDKMTLLDTGRDEPMFEIKREDLRAIAEKLRDDDQFKFDYLANMGGVDTGERFEVVYNVASVEKHHRLDFKLILSYDDAEVESVRDIWPAIDWYERELWELYGINVKNHPNLTRFLLPDDWDQGYPMRKDWDAPDFVRMPEL